MIKFITSALTVFVFIAFYATETSAQELQVRLNDAISDKSVMVEPIDPNSSTFFGKDAGKVNTGGVKYIHRYRSWIFKLNRCYQPLFRC